MSEFKPKLSTEQLKERHKLYQMVVTTFAMQGMKIDEQIELYLKPLLDGSMSREEHEAMLAYLVRENANG